MICVHCAESTASVPCTSCGEEPRALGRWELVEELGRGASGTTFRATDDIGRVVAIKEMPLGRASEGKERELLDREVRVLAQLEHPGIPTFYESAVEGDGRGRVLLLVQEYIEGVDLRTELETHRYSVAEVLVVLDGLLGILDYLHGLSPPVVHRDLKPANVMRRPDGAIVLLDYGAVRDSVRELGGSTVAGTFGYMAPEQLIGDASPISDLYGLGAVAVHLLSRVPPQEMLSVTRGLDWREQVDVPAGVRSLLSDLLEPDPDVRRSRAGSAKAVRARVQRLLLDPDGPAEPPVVQPPQAPPPNAVVAPAVAGALVLTAGLGVAAALFAAEEPDPPQPAVAATPVVEVPHAPPPPAPPPRPAPQPADPGPIVDDVGLGDLPPRGPADAPVRIVMFTDLQCPYCSRATDTLDDLLVSREGEISLWFRDFPLDFHQQARGAHVALRCADDQGGFYALHDRLFDHQRALDRGDLSEHASAVGLDPFAFEACMEGRYDELEARIDRDIAAGEELGVRGTPTFFVNGERFSGAQPLEKFEAAVDRALARLEAPPLE